MSVHLRKGVFAAQIGEDLVLLDLLQDRYLCLPALGAEAGLSPDRRTVRQILPAQAAALGEAGLLSEIGSAPSALPALPARGLDWSLAVEPSRADRLRLARSVLDLATGYMGRGLGEVVAASRAPPHGDGSASLEAVGREARLFHRLVVWAPVGPKCVARSFLLRRFLRRAGCDAAWVFGVRTWPFSAHCWLQHGEVVLDDAPERVAQFEPILAA